MSSSLNTPTLHTVKSLWEERMSAPKGTLGSSGVSTVEWPGFTAAVVLDIGRSLLVAGPAEAIELLRRLSPKQLVEANVTESALLSLRPRLVGKALLGYAEESTFTPAPAAHRVHPADLMAAEQALAHCDADDRDESGLSEMSAWFVAEEEGMPVAAAGFEEWPGGVAHCGVAVGAGYRGRGLGQSVASAAVEHALAGHGVAQWRSRNTNATSTRLGERLGFVQVGSQTAFDLHT